MKPREMKPRETRDETCPWIPRLQVALPPWGSQAAPLGYVV